MALSGSNDREVLEQKYVCYLSQLWQQLQSHQAVQLSEFRQCIDLCDLEQPVGNPSKPPVVGEPPQIPVVTAATQRIDELELQLQAHEAASNELQALKAATTQVEAADHKKTEREAAQRLLELEADLTAAQATIEAKDRTYKDLQALLIEAARQRMSRAVLRLRQLRDSVQQHAVSRLLQLWFKRVAGGAAASGLWERWEHCMRPVLQRAVLFHAHALYVAQLQQLQRWKLRSRSAAIEAASALAMSGRTSQQQMQKIRSCLHMLVRSSCYKRVAQWHQSTVAASRLCLSALRKEINVERTAHEASETLKQTIVEQLRECREQLADATTTAQQRGQHTAAVQAELERQQVECVRLGSVAQLAIAQAADAENCAAATEATDTLLTVQRLETATRAGWVRAVQQAAWVRCWAAVQRSIVTWKQHLVIAGMEQQWHSERLSFRETATRAADRLQTLQQQTDEAVSRVDAAELQKEWRVEALQALEGSDGLADTVIQAEFAVRRAALMGDALELQSASHQLQLSRSAAVRERNELAALRECTQQTAGEVDALRTRLNETEHELLEAREQANVALEASAVAEKRLESMAAAAAAEQATGVDKASAQLALQNSKLQSSRAREGELSAELMQLDSKCLEAQLTARRTARELQRTHSESEFESARAKGLERDLDTRWNEIRDLQARCSEHEAELQRRKAASDLAEREMQLQRELELQQRERCEALVVKLQEKDARAQEVAEHMRNLLERNVQLEAESSQLREHTGHLSNALDQTNKERQQLQQTHESQLIELFEIRSNLLTSSPLPHETSIAIQRLLTSSPLPPSTSIAIQMAQSAAQSAQPDVGIRDLTSTLHLELPSTPTEDDDATEEDMRTASEWWQSTAGGEAEAAVRTMCEQLESPDAQLRGLRSLRLLGSEPAQAAGGCTAVLVAMERHRNHALVQEAGCAALAELTSSVCSGDHPIGLNLVIESIGAAMESHKELAGVQQQAVNALLAVVCTGQQLDLEQLEHLLQVLLDHDTETERILSCFELLRESAERGMKPSEQWVHAIASAAHRKREDSACFACGCQALAALAVVDQTVTVRGLTQAAVGSDLMLHGTSSAAQYPEVADALLDLSALLMPPDAASSDPPLDWELGALVVILQRWPLRKQVVRSGSKLLVWHLENYKQNSMAAVDADTIVLVLAAAFDGLVDDESLLIRLAKVLEAILPSAKSSTSTTVAVRSLAGMMHRYPHVQPLHQHALSVIALSFTEAESIQPQCDSTVLAAVIDSIREHKICAAVQAHGCAVLAAVTAPDTASKAAAASAATMSFVTSLHGQVQEMALHALVCLADRSPLEVQECLVPALPSAAQLVCSSNSGSLPSTSEDLVDDAMQLLAQLCQVPKQERLRNLQPKQERLSLVPAIMALMSSSNAQSATTHNGVTLLHSLSELGAEWCQQIVNAGGMGFLNEFAAKKGPSSESAKVAYATIANHFPVARSNQLPGAWRHEVQAHKQMALTALRDGGNSGADGVLGELDDLFAEFLDAHPATKKQVAQVYSSSLSQHKASKMVRAEFDGVFREWLSSRGS